MLIFHLIYFLYIWSCYYYVDAVSYKIPSVFMLIYLLLQVCKDAEISDLDQDSDTCKLKIRRSQYFQNWYPSKEPQMVDKNNDKNFCHSIDFFNMWRDLYRIQPDFRFVWCVPGNNFYTVL
jgi:hypothetical protein